MPPQCRASRRAAAKHSNGGGLCGRQPDEASPGADGGGGEPSPGAVTAPAAGVGKPCLVQRCGRPGVRTGELPRSCRPFTRAPLGVLSGDPKCAARSRSVQAGINPAGLTELAEGRKDSGHARQSSERARASACDSGHPRTTAAGPGRHSLGAGSSRGATRRRSARAASRRRRPSPDLRRKQTADRPCRRTPQRAVYPLNPPQP